MTIDGETYNTKTSYYYDSKLVANIIHPNGYQVAYSYNNMVLEKVIDSSGTALYEVGELDEIGRVIDYQSR